jgi:hypothetical protein
MAHNMTMPSVRQWPTDESCSWCKQSLEAKKNLRLYEFSKGRAAKLLALCTICVNKCEETARTCPGASATRDLLDKYALKENMPNVPKRRI